MVSVYRSRASEFGEAIAAAGVTERGLANFLGISRGKLYEKIKSGFKSFTLEELDKIIIFTGLGWNEIANIFLPSLSQI